MNIASIATTVPVGPADLASSRPLTDEQRTLIRAVTAINASGMFGQDNELTYTVDRAAHLVVAKLVNKSTGDVIQQIPAEYLLRMAEELSKD